ncbi:PREDICTED: reticulocalbin-2 [Tarenaya hassleriana]|uniref:reticulocalbin-2 n=1 Tax=Tarenaya hassleriana TaxID=28532 RepID=UPI00053C81D3|nr:PREDICTED: reticulocalbin-2 [Tarenaya hassleriana]XP_010546284.1 PREDICTED: reticulocalbin-2 [Tarenaya hassleriana]
MGKASVIIYVTVAVLLLFLISHSPKKKTGHDQYHLHHRRLKLRSSFNFKPNNHKPAPFDPLVADIERRREDKEWERKYFDDAHPEFASHGHGDSAPGHESQPEWEDFMDAEDYLNDEDKFNVTGRLILLFPKIDVDPVDGFVTESELTDWNMRSSEKEVIHRTQREMDVHDKNKDGFVSFYEYEPPSWVRNADNNTFGNDMGWWKEEHFNASDADGDGLLNVTEFNDFLHPADTKNPKLLMWLCKEEVRERDSDKDGKISFQEFFHGIFDTVSNYEEENQNSSHPLHGLPEGPAKQLFGQLDKNGDGFLSDDELLPVITKIHPTERYYAKQQADYIISQADSDKDGRLTLAEMIEHPYVFYSAIFNEEDDDDDDYGFHDEFR